MKSRVRLLSASMSLSIGVLMEKYFIKTCSCTNLVNAYISIFNSINTLDYTTIFIQHSIRFTQLTCAEKLCICEKAAYVVGINTSTLCNWANKNLWICFYEYIYSLYWLNFCQRHKFVVAQTPWGNASMVCRLFIA